MVVSERTELDGEPGTNTHAADSPHSSGARAIERAADVTEVDIAKALLTGGPEGIRIWNERRARDRVRVSLSHIDLAGVNLSGADLCDCVLRYANFSRSILFGARLECSDLTGADFMGARLEATSFKESRLLNARLKGASLRWCDLRSTDLRNANFEDASLSPANIGHADLTGAQFSEEFLNELKASVAILESTGDHPRGVFFALVGLCAFAVLTALGASEVSLVVGVGEIKVPLLDTAVSPRGFFFFVPGACLVLMAYVAAHVRQLEKAARQLPARFPDGATLAEKLTPWMQNVAPTSVERRPVLEDGSDATSSAPTFSRNLLVVTTRWIVPVTATFMLAAYFRSHRPNELAFMGVMVLVAWGAALFMWRPAAGRTLRAHVSFLAMLVAIGLAVYGGGTLSAGRFDARGRDLHSALLQKVTLRGADLSYANLSGAVLSDIDLTGALLFGTNLHNSGGGEVRLFRGRLFRSDLRETYYSRTDFTEAQLNEAKFQDAELRDVTLQRADLRQADLTEARLVCVDVRGADLSTSKVERAQTENLWCDEHTRLPERDSRVVPEFAAACGHLDADCRKRLEVLARRH